MDDAGDSAALVRVSDTELGIVTDSDLRARVVAGGIGPDAPVTEVMSSPAFAVTPERYGADVMLEMLDRNIRHIPVVWPHGEVVGILSDRDLLVTESRSAFVLRRAIEDAAGADDLRRAAAQLRPAIIGLHRRAHLAGRDRVRYRRRHRCVDPSPDRAPGRGARGPAAPLDVARAREPRAARGRSVVRPGLGPGLGRRRGRRRGTAALLPGTGRPRRGRAGGVRLLRRLSRRECGQPLFNSSAASWRLSIRDAVNDPEQGRALVFLSLMFDGRPVHGIGEVRNPLEELRQIWHHQTVLRLMLRLAPTHKPPTGFQRLREPPREFVVEHSGEHRGRLNIKQHGLIPIEAIARYVSLRAHVDTLSTKVRLDAAATAGPIPAKDALALTEAHDLFWELRLEHQVGQLSREEEPDDYIDVKTMDPASRRHARDAFRAVSAVQRSLGPSWTSRHEAPAACEVTRRARLPTRRSRAPGDALARSGATRSWISRRPGSTRKQTRSSPLPLCRSMQGESRWGRCRRSRSDRAGCRGRRRSVSTGSGRRTWRTPRSFRRPRRSSRRSRAGCWSLTRPGWSGDSSAGRWKSGLRLAGPWSTPSALFRRVAGPERRGRRGSRGALRRSAASASRSTARTTRTATRSRPPSSSWRSRLAWTRAASDRWLLARGRPGRLCSVACGTPWPPPAVRKP